MLRIPGLDGIEDAGLFVVGSGRRGDWKEGETSVGVSKTRG